MWPSTQRQKLIFLQKTTKLFFFYEISGRLITSKNLVMGRIPFYRTSNKLKCHYLNIERTRMCSYVGDGTRIPYVRTNKHQTSNLIKPSLDLLTYSSNRLEHCFLNIEGTRTCSASGNQTRTPYFWL